MSELIKMSAAELRDTENSLRAESGKFRECMGQISNHMNSLVNTWQSEAADEFRSQYNKLQSNFDAYYEVIQAQAAALGESARKYEETEQNIKSESVHLDNSMLFR